MEGDERVTEVSGSPFATYTVTSTTHPLSQVKLLVPVIPPTFYAGGLNYPDHVQWWATYSGTPPRLATEPGIGYRTNNALIAHGEHQKRSIIARLAVMAYAWATTTFCRPRQSLAIVRQPPRRAWCPS